MAIPEWAEQLIAEVCKDHKRWPPEIRWHTSSTNRLSSGRTHYAKSFAGKQLYTISKTGRTVKDKGHIVVTAGTVERDQKLVLLHELAHWVVGKNKSQGHTKKFWDLAFEMYDKYGDIVYAFDREKDYKVGASDAWRRRHEKATKGVDVAAIRTEYSEIIASRKHE